MQHRSGRDAREDTLPLEEEPEPGDGLLVRDEELPVELRDVEDRRHVAVRERAQAHHLVTRERLRCGDDHIGKRLAQPLAGAHQRATGPETGHEDVDAVEGDGDLRARAVVVRARVRDVPVLERHEERRLTLRKLERQPHRPVRAFLRGRVDDLRPVQAKETPTLLGHVRRHDAGERIAAQLRLERERDPGVSAGGFEQMPPRLQLARCLGRIDHRLGNPILDEPVGFWPSSFAYRRTDGFGERRGSSTSGVEPIRSRRDGASAFGRSDTAGHRRQEDHGLAVVDRRLEPVERPDVLAAEVHVHERRKLAPGVELSGERREALDEIIDHGADGLPSCLQLAEPADLRPERGGNAHGRHQLPPTGALQNST